MSQNPFGTPGSTGPSGYAPDYPDPWSGATRQSTQARLSVLAVVALICSALCVTGPIGIILGVVAFVVIGRSDGRLWGRGLAIAAVVVGLLVTTVLGGLAYSGVRAYQMVIVNLVEPGKTALNGVQAGDPAALRGLLDPAAAVTDEQLAAFATRVREDFGAFKGFGAVSPSAGRNPPPQIENLQLAGDLVPFPVPVGFEKKSGFFCVVMPVDKLLDVMWNRQASAPGVNLILIAEDGTILPLIPLSPANAPAGTPNAAPGASPPSATPPAGTPPAGAPGA